MANRAYASLWFRDFSESTQLEHFSQFLQTVPYSATRPGFTQLVIHALDPAEVPVQEHDLRSIPLDAASIIELSSESLHADSAYETEAYWDLWVYDATLSKWQLVPQPLGIFCYGEDYDDATWQENGHVQVDIGFEHLFTGHAGLLGFRRDRAAQPQHPAEADFLAAMAEPTRLEEYQDKTRANIRKLLDWTQRLETRVPTERLRLWSEGEENFEARLEEILVVR
ncbi:MAG: hypothetical protein WBC04_09970 [Candidatus Acidiferrales bacterium]